MISSNLIKKRIIIKDFKQYENIDKYPFCQKRSTFSHEKPLKQKYNHINIYGPLYVCPVFFI